MKTNHSLEHTLCQSTSTCSGFCIWKIWWQSTAPLAVMSVPTACSDCRWLRDEGFSASQLWAAICQYQEDGRGASALSTALLSVSYLPWWALDAGVPRGLQDSWAVVPADSVPRNVEDQPQWPADPCSDMWETVGPKASGTGSSPPYNFHICHAVWSSQSLGKCFLWSPISL